MLQVICVPIIMARTDHFMPSHSTSTEKAATTTATK